MLRQDQAEFEKKVRAHQSMMIIIPFVYICLFLSRSSTGRYRTSVYDAQDPYVHVKEALRRSSCRSNVLSLGLPCRYKLVVVGWMK
jgi:hypothetical protein